MKDGLHAGNKMNSLARSNASLYKGGASAAQGVGGGVGVGPVPVGGAQGNEDLYDRLRRHAYQGKKSGEEKSCQMLLKKSQAFFFSDFALA